MSANPKHRAIDHAHAERLFSAALLFAQDLTPPYPVSPQAAVLLGITAAARLAASDPALLAQIGAAVEHVTAEHNPYLAHGPAVVDDFNRHITERWFPYLSAIAAGDSASPPAQDDRYATVIVTTKGRARADHPEA